MSGQLATCAVWFLAGYLARRNGEGKRAARERSAP